MINLSPTPRRSGVLILCLTLIGMVSPPVFTIAQGAPKYKKQTVVDFEGALVEGKSRKPYSAYLTQQKESAFGDLNDWHPDLEKSLKDTQTRLDKSL